jgi:hypothetical protein
MPVAKAFTPKKLSEAGQARTRRDEHACSAEDSKDAALHSTTMRLTSRLRAAARAQFETEIAEVVVQAPTFAPTARIWRTTACVPVPASAAELQLKT